MLERKRPRDNVVDMAKVRQRDLDAEAMPAVGARIVAARVGRELDVEELAYLARVKPGALRAYEHGQRIPNAFSAVRIALVLHLDVAQLFASPTREELADAKARAVPVKKPKKRKAA